MRDVLVIGGGIIGLLTARELQLSGAKVTLIEMGETGRESSWASGGILSPLYPWRAPEPITSLARWSQDLYPVLTAQLLESTGIDPEFTVSGLLVLDDEDLDQALDWGVRHGQPIEVIQDPPPHVIEPELGPHLARALHLPGIAQLRPPRLSKAIRRALERRIDLREREEVIERLIDGDRVRGVRTPKGRVEAGDVVICAGAWTAKLLEQLGAPPTIQPVRGQMLLFHAKPGQIHHITLYAGRYAIPRRDGRVLFGSTLEHTGFVKRTTAEDKEALYHEAIELFPVLRRTPIEDHWAGLRPGSPRGIPYIGAYPGIEGLYFNAGHFRNGLVMGPASARLMVDLILDREPILDPAPYALNAPR
jgi:glycine oxidase (EC 1.4.3.19)